MLEYVTALRDVVAEPLADSEERTPYLWTGGGGGSGSGPAELPVIELGITVRRERGKA